MAVSGRTVGQLHREITQKYGMLHYEEASFTTTPERKCILQQQVYEQDTLPDFGAEILSISRQDGCKVLFKDGSWVICRFSGTEPLLRMAAEGGTHFQAQGYIRIWSKFLGI